MRFADFIVFKRGSIIDRKTKNLCTIDQTRLKPLIQMN